MTEESRIYHRQYRKKNLDKIRAYQKEYRKRYAPIYRSTPEYKIKAREYSKRFRVKHPEKIRAYRANATKHHVNPSTPKLSLRFRVFLRDNFTCQYCGRNVKEDSIKLELDHVHPKSKGGVDRFENYITSCKDCNIGKLNKVLNTEVLAYLK